MKALHAWVALLGSVGLMWPIALPAATMLVHEYEVTASASDDTSTGGSPAATAIVTERIDGTGTNRGFVAAWGSSLLLEIPELEPDDFTISTRGAFSALVFRTSPSGKGEPVSASASHSVMFDVGLNENVEVAFDMVTTLNQGNVPGRILWELKAPDGSVVAAISGTVTENGASVVLPTQTAILEVAGTYELIVTAEVPESSKKQGVLAQVNSFSFQATSIPIPEPEVLAGLLVGMILMAGRRRR